MVAVLFHSATLSGAPVKIGAKDMPFDKQFFAILVTLSVKFPGSDFSIWLDPEVEP